MKPLLKWAGGKRLIAPILKESFPHDWDRGTYIEPFVGGAAMFLHLSPQKSIIADINVRLYSFYVHIKEQSNLVFEGISKIAEIFNALPAIEKKEYYLKIRNEYNISNVESVDSAVLLFALNKLCFNGLYRENSKGGFNVPFGQKNLFPELVENDFQEVAKALKKAIIKNSDFETTISSAKSGDFVYLDPPYKGLFDLLSIPKTSFLWVTDGEGWNTTRLPLKSAFEHIDYVWNLNWLSKGYLKDLF